MTTKKGGPPKLEKVSQRVEWVLKGCIRTKIFRRTRFKKHDSRCNLLWSSFKNKWLKQSPDDSIRVEIDKSIEEAKEELYTAFALWK